MNRGDVLTHPLRERHFAIVSTNRLTETGTLIVAEIATRAPTGTRGMLTVQLGRDDPLDGVVLAYRLNWLSGDRVSDWKFAGRLTETTLDLVAMALRTAMDL